MGRIDKTSLELLTNKKVSPIKVVKVLKFVWVTWSSLQTFQKFWPGYFQCKKNEVATETDAPVHHVC